MRGKSYTDLVNDGRPTRCIDGRLLQHRPQADDPYLEVDIGACPGCDECDPEDPTLAEHEGDAS